MKKVTLATICVLLSAVAAHAEIFNYACGTATKGYADVEMNGQVQEEFNLMKR